MAAAFGASYLFNTNAVAAVASGAFLGDLISGVAHFVLDYWPIERRELAWHRESTIPSVKNFTSNNRLYLTSSDWDQFLWQFHSHHDVPYPSDRPVVDLMAENLVFGIPICGAGVAAASYGFGTKLKGSIGEGPNHSNYSDHSSVNILSELRKFC